MRHERILPERPTAEEGKPFTPNNWWHWWKSLGTIHSGYMDDNTVNAYTWKIQPYCHWHDEPWKFEAIAGVEIRTAFVSSIPAKDLPLVIETLQEIYDNFLYLRTELEKYGSTYETKSNPQKIQEDKIQE